MARVVVALTIVLLAVVLAFASASDAEGVRVSWDPHTIYSYTINTKWWFGSSPSSELSGDDVAQGWAPPVSPDNHGMRCPLSVQPVRRETWPPSSAHTDTNAWLLKATVGQCVPTRSRFDGEYVALPRPQEQDAAANPTAARIGTPFFVLRGDEGLLHRMYFFGNETQKSRNFKRGVVAFLGFVHPRVAEEGGESYTVVDQDENGVYVVAVWRHRAAGLPCGGLTVCTHAPCVCCAGTTPTMRPTEPPRATSKCGEPSRTNGSSLAPGTWSAASVGARKRISRRLPPSTTARSQQF